MKVGFGHRVRPRLVLSALIQGLVLAGLVLGEPGYAAAAHVAIARATAPEAGKTETTAIEDHNEGDPFTAEQLETLIGPVALYPDELLGIVLPASTYPLQIVQAARYLEKVETDDSLEPDESWDESVLGLLNYPEIITMMNDDLNWTWQLGEAAANQQQELMGSAQSFRGRARDAGNLVTNEQMVVSEQEEDGEQAIIIESTSTEVIYVPVYQPSTVVVHYGYPYPWYYSPPYPYYYHPRARFWTGVAVGVAVGYGCRWGRRGGDITVNRNVNVNVDRPGGGNRPGNGDRPGNRPGTKPTKDSAQSWKADANRGKQSGGRPGNADTRPSAGSRDRASGTRPSQGGAGDRAATRPSTGGAADRSASRPSQGGGTRPSTGTANRAGSGDRSGASARPSTSQQRTPSRSGHTASTQRSKSNGSFGSYQSRGSSQRHSSRGASSRGGHRGGGGRGGRR